MGASGELRLFYSEEKDGRNIVVVKIPNNEVMTEFQVLVAEIAGVECRKLQIKEMLWN